MTGPTSQPSPSSRAALPIDAYLPEVRAALACSASLIVKAAPGAGKTTRVPPELLGVVPGRVIVLEPRRLAARLSAERVAAERGEPCGQTIGYQIRFDAKTSAATRLTFVTEGVFLRLALDAPKLDGVSAVVIDEFHERHIHTDLALAMVRRLQQGARPDLKLIVMSATLDSGALETYLPEAKVLNVPGRTFPVVIEYLPPGTNAGESDEGVEDAVADAVARLLRDHRCPGDVLVFLTGIQEIRRVAGRITRIANEGGAEVLPLAADLSYQEQARAFAKGGRRKIILSTNVAETSLTLPGVTGVIDSGRAKIAGHASWSGMPTLDVKKISQASCIQRSGRAGRTAPGVAYRLYSEADFLGRQPFTLPDIRRLDLAETYLDVMALRRALGESAKPLAEALPWFEAPEAKAVASAEQLLRHLGAIDAQGVATPRGEQLARIPLHPRLAAIVIKGKELGVAEEALGAACLISERMLLGLNAPATTHEESDVHLQLSVLAKLAAGQSIAPRALAEAVDQGRAKQILSLYDNLAGRLRLGRLAVRDKANASTLGACLLAGFPDRVAKRRVLPNEKRDAKARPLYNFCLGRGGFLAPSSVVHDADLILALEAAETQSRSADRGTAIYVAAEISMDLLYESPADLLREETGPVWVEDAERVDMMERIYYGEIVVSESRIAIRPEHARAVETLLAEKLAERWPKPFEDDGDLVNFHERARLLSARRADLTFPRFEGELLTLLQAAICEGKRGFKEIAERPLLAYIEDQLPYELKTKLAEATPAEVRLTNGRTLRVVYESGRPPFLTGFIQDFFGLTSTPTLPGSPSPLTLHILGPNKRPLQVTADLAGFWQRSYPAVRSELGRKYPRHYWPERPETAGPYLHVAKVPKA